MRANAPIMVVLAAMAIAMVVGASVMRTQRLRRDAERHVRRGAESARAGDVDEAARQFRKAIEANRNNAAAHTGLGGVLVAQGKADEALPVLRRALELDPNQHEAHHNLGRALYATGDVPGAVAELKRALEIDEGFAPAWRSLGDVHAQGTKDVAEALRCYRRYLALLPEEREARDIRAYVGEHERTSP